jgi:hypothetical protein
MNIEAILHRGVDYIEAAPRPCYMSQGTIGTLFLGHVIWVLRVSRAGRLHGAQFVERQAT